MSAITAKARRKMKKYAVLTREPRCFLGSFDFSWEQRKVGDLLIERNQQAPMSDEYPLMAFIANEGVAPKGERYDRSALVTDTVNKLYKKTEKGDFIYSSNNLETGSIGLNKYGKACISPVYSIFEPTGIADSDFLGRRLVRKDFINAMVKWRQGVIYGQWRIHESDFLKIEITVPSVEEQRKIGAYLDQLDNLITLHQRKCALLFSSFQALISMMFTTSTFSWEQRKFGDIASDMVAGGDIDKDLILAEGQYPVIANALTGDGIVGYYDKEYRVNAPAVTVTGRGDVGHAKARLVNFTPVVRLLAVKSEHDVFFLENAINTLKIVIESTGVPQLTVPQLAKYEVAFPRQLDEEEHIGAFFKHLDHLITLHQRELEKLQNIKKSMLEKMFV